MKKNLLIFLLALSGLISFGQVNKFTSTGRQNSVGFSQSDILSRNVDFVNTTSPTHKVWRDGTASSGIIKLPIGYNGVSWDIVRHDAARTVVLSGSTFTVSWTPSYVSGVNVYDLVVYGTRLGYPTREHIFVGEIQVLPPIFTEGQADVVYDLSSGGTGSKDGLWTDRGAGGNIYKIFVKGTYTGTSNFNPYYWMSSNDSKPVHFIFSNASINCSGSAVKMFSPGIMRNVIFDGSTDENVKYGFTLTRTANLGECIYFTSSDGAQPSRTSKRITFTGIKVENTDSSLGGSGFVVATTADATNNYNTTVLDQLYVSNILLQNTRDEGFYLGHFNDSPSPTYAFSPITNSIYWRLITNHTGNESFQIGSHFDTDVFNCQFLDAGTRNYSAHRNNLQFSQGNRNLSVYMNYFEGSKNVWQGFTGVGGRNNYLFSNLFYSTGKPGLSFEGTDDGINSLIRLEQNSLYASVEWQVFHNTFIIKTGIPFNYYLDVGSPTTIFNKLINVNNLITTDTSTPSTLNNGFSSSWLIEASYQTTNVNVPKFFNVDDKNFKLAALSSPAYTTETSFTKFHPLSLYDKDGAKYFSDVMGCYSGYENITGPTIVRKISAVSNQASISVPFGTVFGSTGLSPTTLVTNSDGSTRSLPVTWSSAGYNGSLAGTYAIGGTLDLTGDTDELNPNNTQPISYVTVNAALPSTNFKVNFFTGTASGWWSTGSTSPFASNTIVDFGQIDATGVGLRALNDAIVTNYWGGTGSSGGTGGVYPNAVSATYWFSPTASGKVSTFELYQFSGTPLTGRLFTIKILCSRAGVTTRTTRITINGASPSSSQDVNCGNNINTLLTFTNVPVSGNKIVVVLEGVAPSDNFSGHINGMEVDSQ